jgi:hypothetical protein
MLDTQGNGCLSILLRISFTLNPRASIFTACTDKLRLFRVIECTYLCLYNKLS